MELAECGSCVALFTRITLALQPGWLDTRAYDFRREKRNKPNKPMPISGKVAGAGMLVEADIVKLSKSVPLLSHRLSSQTCKFVKAGVPVKPINVVVVVEVPLSKTPQNRWSL